MYVKPPTPISVDVPCSVCKQNKGDVRIVADPYVLDICNEVVTRILCEACEDDIAADI